MAQQIQVDPAAVTGEAEAGGVIGLLPDLAYRRVGMVNVVLAGGPVGEAVLIDAGLPGTAPVVRSAWASRFGEGRKPAAIMLTHGHIDHVGALQTLLEEWDVPVYAHPDELPYLNGTAAYPPPDTRVGGGLMSRLAGLFPRQPIDVSRWLQPLPADGGVPGLPGWRWLHTPGHSVGHVSFWREADRALIAGDAFITTAQESAYAVATQDPELHGPPMYFTADWGAAAQSVRALAGLQPALAVTGHGRAMQGSALRAALGALAAQFEHVAVPKGGHYVLHPARVSDGSAYDRAGD